MSFYGSHVFVEVTLPAGMVLRMGRGLAPRQFDIPVKVMRCEWCGIVAPPGRRMRCYGLPLKAGATVAIPQPEPVQELREPYSVVAK